MIRAHTVHAEFNGIIRKVTDCIIFAQILRMKKLVYLLVFFPLLAYSQEAGKWGIRFSGYVKNDFFYDTRQVENLREGHFLMYPLNVDYDNDSADINAQGSLNFLSIQSRLRGDISAPDVLGAKTSGVLEAEFWGTSNADVNGLRLRHAFVKLNWKSTELLLGQTWHPMTVAGCLPDVVAVNTGAPLQPFSRNPQIRLTQKAGPLNVMVALLAQRDMTSTGPEGASSKYLRNAAVPDMQAQVFYALTSPDEKNEVLAGIGAGYKMLKPRLVTDSNYKTTATLGSLSGIAYLKIRRGSFFWKIEGVYAQNAYDMLMLGGYAIQYDTSAANLLRDERSYTNLHTISAWTEVGMTFKKIQVGIFGGYTQNLGSWHNVANWTSPGSYYTRGYNIHHLYRIAPRVAYVLPKFKIALEGDYTAAAYGREISPLAQISDLNTVSNIRILLGVFYFF